MELKPTASGAVGLCPLHDDHHPSFGGVNEAGNYRHCFAGYGEGAVIDSWLRWRKCDFTTAVRELAEMGFFESIVQLFASIPSPNTFQISTKAWRKGRVGWGQ